MYVVGRVCGRCVMCVCMEGMCVCVYVLCVCRCMWCVCVLRPGVNADSLLLGFYIEIKIKTHLIIFWICYTVWDIG